MTSLFVRGPPLKYYQDIGGLNFDSALRSYVYAAGTFGSFIKGTYVAQCDGF